MTLLAGRYRLGGAIGQGGMAVVRRADDRVLRQPVAVKMLTPDRAQNQAHQAAVRREARTGVRLRHPNIARVLDYGETDNAGPFLVMELVPGPTLAARLTAHGPLPWPEAAAACAGIARALAAAHARDLVHRDVKPANIMLAPGGAKLVDFGFADRTGGPSTDADGRVWGTPAYLAPEQLHGRPTGPATDVYALALVLHSCLTGGPAWPGTDPDEVVRARVARPVPRLSGVAGTLFDECVAIDPETRPTAECFAYAIEALNHSESHGGRL
ncbi:serine/threonine protein kinase [Actinoplanes sp. LDG1-06]|uniref:non-specific serine/threonine protein kinase n=1 Tax=Paractinoplanes ovalisporus TaxID=2810368 RepID=A0ABS2A3X4_9ACTN|nr:serine/threonine-protein kinase [Actinoplanes ovalisporus]MBM2614545.1 serine/threonine protein kinase [Actinoplanes ovalisporus]